jgi:hypothetical protein
LPDTIGVEPLLQTVPVAATTGTDGYAGVELATRIETTAPRWRFDGETTIEASVHTIIVPPSVRTAPEAPCR